MENEKTPRQLRIEELQRIFRAKHPNYTEKAILNLAITIANLDDYHDEDEEDENPITPMRQAEIYEGVHILETYFSSELQQEQTLKLKAIANDPKYKGLFNGYKQPSKNKIQKVGINSVDGLGRSELHYAAEKDDKPKALKLIRDGASLFLKDTAGHTPYQLALRKGHITMAAFLIKEKIGLEWIERSQPSQLMIGEKIVWKRKKITEITYPKLR